MQAQKVFCGTRSVHAIVMFSILIMTANVVLQMHGYVVSLLPSLAL